MNEENNYQRARNCMDEAVIRMVGKIGIDNNKKGIYQHETLCNKNSKIMCLFTK